MPILNRLVRSYLAHSPITEGKRALLRASRKAIAPSEPVQVAWTRHGFQMRLNLDNPEQAHIYFFGEHDERYETALLKRLVRQGMTCWDIGANIGYYSCLFATRVGATGRVIAFEPASRTRERLRENVALNALSNLDVEPHALGERNGAARIHYRNAAHLEGTASLHASAAQGQSEEISLRTLDSLASVLPLPDLVKIDVEGNQLAVWRGGHAFFSGHEPVVMAELRDSDDPQVLEEIEREVRGCGYRIFSIHKWARVREVRRLDTAGPRNFILAKPGTRGDAFLQSRSG